MPFNLPEERYQEIQECWAISPNAIEVLVSPNKRHDHNHWVRVTARESVRSGATPRYWAGYEEKITIRDADRDERTTWVETRYPWHTGESIQECLDGALQWVVGGDE